MLAGILALGLALRLWSFSGIFGADDVAVADVARRLLAEGFSVPTGHYEQRIGLIFPLALIFQWFGAGDWQFALMPLAASMLTIALAYAIGRHVASDAVGLLAAFLLAIFPLDVSNATLLFPDTVMAGYVALAFYLVLRAEQSRHPALLSLMAGLLLGIGWLVKVEAILLVPVLGIYWLLDPGRRWRGALLAGVGMAAVLGAESLAYYLLANDPLRSIHAAVNQGEARMNEAYSATQLWIFPKAWFVTLYEFGLHYYLLFAAMFWVVAQRRREYYVLLAWVLIVFLWLEFGGNPFSAHYHVKSHLPRYCVTVSVPTVVLMAALLVHYWQAGRRRLVSAAFGTATALALVLVNFNTLAGEGTQATKRGLDYALDHEAFPLFLDKKSYDLATWYLDGKVTPGALRPVQRHDFRTQQTRLLPAEDINGWVLDNTVFADYALKRYGMRPIADVLTPSRFVLEKSIDNPGSRLAYVQAEAISGVLAALPDSHVTRKARATVGGLLEGGEVRIYRPAP